jgi:hypothetical protein
MDKVWACYRAKMETAVQNGPTKFKTEVVWHAYKHIKIREQGENLMYMNKCKTMIK